MKKIISISILICLIALIVLLNMNKKEILSVPIPTEYSICQNDSECTTVQVSCSNCDQGMGINKKYKSKYLEEKNKKCQNYKGLLCDMKVYKLITKCINNKCVVIDTLK